MFKDKTSKKRINNMANKDNCTLNIMHLNIIKDFENKKKEYDDYIDKRDYLNKKVDFLSSNILILNDNNILDSNYDNLWNSNILIKEEIIKIDKKIKDLVKYNEVDYYNDTSHILFNYYDMIEKESKNIFTNQKTILDALNNKNETVNNLNTDKSQLVDEYLSLTDKKHIKKTSKENLEICKECDTKLTCLQHEAILVCEKCGYQETLLVEQNRPILKQNAKDTSHFTQNI